MATTTNKDYYDILGVAKDASTEDIKKAFRAKARTMHPDVSKAPDAEERFKEVTEAYETLSDPDKRARYDAVRSGGFTTENPFRPSGTSSGSPYGAPFGGPQDPFGWASWGFPFGGAYTGRRSSGRPTGEAVPYVVESGATRRIALRLSAEEAKKGCAKNVSYQHLEACTQCRGKGTVASSEVVACPACGGVGHVEASMGGLFATAMKCPACGGSGKVIRNPCPSCHGTGTSSVRTTTRVEVPAGSHDGGGVRIPGMGDAGRCGGPSGDLQVDFEVPSEHLTQGQEIGFTAAGVVCAMALCSVFASTVLRIFAFLALPLFFVFFFVSPSVFKKKGGSFWQRAARRFGYGLVLGLFVFIVFSPAMTCMRLF